MTDAAPICDCPACNIERGAWTCGRFLNINMEARGGTRPLPRALGDEVRHLGAFTPTAEEIEAAKSPAGGWTKEQLAVWGVPWPPPKGWKHKLLSPQPTRLDEYTKTEWADIYQQVARSLGYPPISEETIDALWVDFMEMKHRKAAQ